MTGPMQITVGTKDLSEDDAVAVALALMDLFLDGERPPAQRLFLAAVANALADDYHGRQQVLDGLEAACDDPLAGWMPPDPET